MDVHSSNFTLCSFEPGYGIEADKIFGQTQIKEDIFNSTVKYINNLKCIKGIKTHTALSFVCEI